MRVSDLLFCVNVIYIAWIRYISLSRKKKVLCKPGMPVIARQNIPAKVYMEKSRGCSLTQCNLNLCRPLGIFPVTNEAVLG